MLSSMASSTLWDGFLDMTDDKVKENLMRRKAERQGLRLEKSPRRDRRAIGYGTYQIVHTVTEIVVARSLETGYGLTLDDVRELLDDRTEGIDPDRMPANLAAFNLLETRPDWGSANHRADLRRLIGDWTAQDLTLAAEWSRQRGAELIEEGEKYKAAGRLIKAYGVRYLGEVPGWSEEAFRGDGWREHVDGLMAKAPKRRPK